MKLLDFVALYGFILAPIGAVIFFDFYFSEKLGMQTNYAAKKNIRFHWPVLAAWALSMIIGLYVADTMNAFLSFFTLPVWLLCGVLFLLFSKTAQKSIS